MNAQGMLWEPLGRLLGDLGTVQREVLCRSYGNCRNSQKLMPKWMPRGGFGSLLGLWRACSGGIVPPWRRFGRRFCTTLACSRRRLDNIFRKTAISLFQHLSAAELVVFGDGATKLEPSGLQNGCLGAVWTARMATDRASREVRTAKRRSSLAGRFGALSELWERPET